jgi:hypothetical protein
VYASAAWKICSAPSALIPSSCRILEKTVPLRLHRDARLRSGQTAKTAHRCQALAPGSGARGSSSTRATNTMSPQSRREICVGCSCASTHHTYGRYFIRCVYIYFEKRYALPNGSSLNQPINQPTNQSITLRGFRARPGHGDDGVLDALAVDHIAVREAQSERKAVRTLGRRHVDPVPVDRQHFGRVDLDM